MKVWVGVYHWYGTLEIHKLFTSKPAAQRWAWRENLAYGGHNYAVEGPFTLLTLRSRKRESKKTKKVNKTQ